MALALQPTRITCFKHADEQVTRPQKFCQEAVRETHHSALQDIRVTTINDAQY